MHPSFSNVGRFPRSDLVLTVYQVYLTRILEQRVGSRDVANERRFCSRRIEEMDPFRPIMQASDLLDSPKNNVPGDSTLTP